MEMGNPMNNLKITGSLCKHMEILQSNHTQRTDDTAEANITFCELNTFLQHSRTSSKLFKPLLAKRKQTVELK
jgi:hypothetical protein